MSTQADKTKENSTQPVINEGSSVQSGRDDSFQFVDNRSEALVQKTLQEMADSSVEAKQVGQLQRNASAEGGSPRDIHTAAVAGVQGSGSQLPHFNRIQKSFGTHNLSHVQAYTGSAAATASRSIGAEAYATGSKIAFATPSPSLHTAAHEAAHIVQQQAGVQLSGGVGTVGDKYERHADAVADRVVQGQSAESLLNSFTGIPTGNSGEATPRLNMLAAGASRVPLAVQRLNVGMVPNNPNTFRYYTTLASAGGTRGGAPFTKAQRTAVLANNIAAAAGAVPVLAAGAGNYPASDSTKGALLTAAEANKYAPQVDHIVEAKHGGANDYDNARVLSQGENNGSIPLKLMRPVRATRRMRAYQNVTIKAAKGAPGYVPANVTIAAKNNFTMPQIKSMARYANVGIPANYAGITNAMIAGIVGAGNGTANSVTIS